MIAFNAPIEIKDDGMGILVFVIFLVVAGLLYWLLIRGIKRDRIKLLEQAKGKEETSKSDFDKILQGRFKSANKNTNFTLYFIKLNDVENQRSAYGAEQFSNAFDSLLNRLEKSLPLSAKMCRYYDDVITVLVDGLRTEQQVKEITSAIVYELKAPVILAANLRLSFSYNVGLSRYNEFSRTSEQMMQNVQIALDAGKRNGANQVAEFSFELANKESEAYKFYQEVKEAIAEKEFLLYYQPIVDIAGNKVYGYESLLRWNHKTKGVLSPATFLNILEQTGDINWLGLWAFEELLKQQLEWKREHPSVNLVLSMNLSPKQLLNENLADEMRKIIRRYRVEPSSICMEIVEFAMYDKVETIRNNITKLHQAGFKLAIDDLGLETHTLSLLESLEIDVVKLNRKFLENAKDNIITTGIINLLLDYANKKNAIVVAEGIEDKEVLETVKNYKIEYGQGYYFGRPSDAKDVKF